MGGNEDVEHGKDEEGFDASDDDDDEEDAWSEEEPELDDSATTPVPSPPTDEVASTLPALDVVFVPPD